MKKTLTAALALTAFAGFAYAASIGTPAAGYIEKSTQELVCNPFVPFDNPVSVPTLGDIDGSSLGNGDWIGLVAPDGKMTKFYWHDNGWYDAQSNGNSANDVVLVRGDAIQFHRASGTLAFSGIITNCEVVAKTANNGGYTVFGNASPVDKDLYDFSISGADYDPARDYVSCNGGMYVFQNNKWYEKDSGDEVSRGDVTVPAGKGLFLCCQKRRKWTAPTITVPGTY